MLLRFFLDSKRSNGALQRLSCKTTPQTGLLPLGNEEDRLELKLPFDGEVLHSEVVLPVIRK